jgi:hypothetical protein
MDSKDIADRISFILSGETFFSYNDSIYNIKSPCPQDKSLANYFLEGLNKKFRFKELLDQDELEKHLSSLGIWTPDDDQKFKDSEEHVDKLKVSLFESLYNKKAQKSIKSQIAGIRKALDKARLKKFSLFDQSIEYHNIQFKKRFLVAVNLYDLEGKKLYKASDFHSIPSDIIDRGVKEWEEECSISQEEMREIVRCGGWSTHWSLGKEKMFGKAICMLNEIQRTALVFSKMYDNARQSPECPPDEVFEDDDMFDGWMIKQREKAEQDRKKRRADKLHDERGGGKQSDAGELYLMAENPEEATDVARLNAFAERMRLRDQMREVKSAGGAGIEEINLTQTQMDLRRQLMDSQKK